MQIGSPTEHVEWMLFEFKTQPCASDKPAATHDHRCCPSFHNDRDRRRPPLSRDGLVQFYKGEPCPSKFDDENSCPQGDACTMCHSTAELLYHPEFFRKRLCHQAKRCPRAGLCAFAHAREELLVPHFSENTEAHPTEEFVAYRFKTLWCPVGGPHDWENCVYAHTHRDWRRTPGVGYSSHPCPQWARSVSSGVAEMNYAQRCPHGLACPLAHGAKEQLYHPQFYKTNPCSDAKCRRGFLCAFTHGPHDRRTLAVEEQPKLTSRGPLPGAEALLRAHQPTFDNPPIYHALEDMSRQMRADSNSSVRSFAGRSNATAKNGRKAKGNAGDAASGAARGRARRQQNFPVSQDFGDSMANQAAFMYGGNFSPMIWGDMTGANYFVVEAWPGSPVADGITNACAGSPGYQRLVGMGPDASDRSPAMTGTGMMQSPFGFAVANMPLQVPKKSKSRSGDGWRTPSSFGSRPASNAPTAVSTPRLSAEGSSTGPAESSEPHSWDDAGRDTM